MPAVYTELLFRRRGVTSLEEVYVQPFTRWVVRSIDCYCSADALGNAALNVFDRYQDATFCYMEWLALERASKHWNGRQVIEYAEGLGGLKIENFGSSAVDVSITGYVFEDPLAGPAPVMSET
jgi:hypothetical protein